MKRYFLVIGLSLAVTVAWAGDARGVVIKFDASLDSMALTGGPYPMPLASDPGNVLFPDVGGGIAPDGGPAGRR